MIPESFEARHVRNNQATRSRPYGPDERSVLSLEGFEAARAEIGSWPGYRPTPLVPLPALARDLGIGTILYKDEAQRLGLESFKALGGAYAVLVVLQRRLAAGGGGSHSAQDFLSGRLHDRAAQVTVAAATDGNHGRSVAWGARMFGAKAVIYLHQHVSPERERQIARFGARIVRVPGGYDGSVRRCAEDAARHGWELVADTSSDPAAGIPALVMQGYTLIAEEILEQIGAQDLPTHLFVQAGVGGLAAALGAHFWERLGPDRPRLVVVEPSKADCVLRAVAAGRPVAIEGDTDTFMACLAAGEISAPAWVILRHVADDVLALPDEAAPAAMRLLAAGQGGDPVLVSGESGCAAVAGLLAAAGRPALRRELGLGETSRVVVIGSEGATDVATYRQVVGNAAHDIAGAAG